MFGVGIRHNLDGLAAGNGGVAVHFENGQKDFVNLTLTHGAIGDQRHLAFDARINNEIFPGDLGGAYAEGTGLVKKTGDAGYSSTD